MPTYRVLFIAAQIAAATAAVSAALLFVGVGILVALHVSIVGKAFQRWSIAASSTDGGGGNGGREIRDAFGQGLSPEELRALPCYEFRRRSGLVDGQCVVCLDSFGAGEWCRLLPACRHSFHARCVDRWLLTAPVCPICRTRAAAETKHQGEGGVH